MFNVIKLVEFDVRGDKEVNQITGEVIQVKDKTCPYLIPNGSPFFDLTNSTKVYNESGGELLRGRDYWLVGEFTPFCELSGKSVVTFIKLSNRTLSENESVSVDYQSIGASFVPRNGLEEWLDGLNVGRIPIPFDPKVLKIPKTLPPKKHKHSVRSEVTDWFELTYFYHVISDILNNKDSELPTRIDQAVTAAYNQLYLNRDSLSNSIADHEENYHNPHQITKAHLDRGNLDNFATATVGDEYAGVRNDLFSTSAAVYQIAEERLTPDTSNLFRAGILPFSHLTFNNYPGSPYSGWLVPLPKTDVTIDGVTYPIPSSNVDLRDVVSSPGNKTYYVYVTIRRGRGVYITSTKELRRSSKLLHVLTVKTNATTISSIVKHDPFVIDGYELSTVRKGGIIPVSSGLPQDPGTFKFLRNSELLP